MADNTVDNNLLFKDTTIKKMAEQDRRMTELEQKVGNPPTGSGDVEQMKKDIGEIKAAVKGNAFPLTEMQEFSRKLMLGLSQFQQPVEKIVEHHHHVPKITWIAAGLLVALCLTCSGWYMTAATLEQYRAADTQYRYLQLIGDTVVGKVMYQVDSLYRNGYAMQDSVAQWEEDRQRAEELRTQLLQNAGEGWKLRSKLDALDAQNEARRKIR